MQTALALDEFVATDISLRVKFDSSLILLDDLEALVALTKDVISTVEQEVLLQTGETIELLPLVSIKPGSIILNLKLKGSKWSADLKLKTTDILLATVLVAFPTAGGEQPKPTPVEPSEQCVAMIGSAVEKANETWQYFGKGFESEIEISCGAARAKYTVKNPPRRS